MAFDSFRDFVNALDQAGELKRISQPVATELEITEIADREMKSPGGGKALLFEKPTINGVVSPFPVAINTLGSHKRMAMSMGADSVDEVADELGALDEGQAAHQFRRSHQTARHRAGSAPRQTQNRQDRRLQGSHPQVEVRKSQLRAGRRRRTVNRTGNVRPATCPTLLNLPILKCWPLDGGRFITLPCVVTRDPDTGERNVGMYRIQIYDDQTTGMHWQLQKVAARHGRRYYETGERMPVAVFLGGDPDVHLLPPPPRCRTAWTNFSSPVICAKNPSNWSNARPTTSKSPPTPISSSKATSTRPNRCATKGRSAITPAITRCPSRIPSSTSPPSPTARTPSIPPPSSAFRRWRISTSAAPA